MNCKLPGHLTQKLQMKLTNPPMHHTPAHRIQVAVAFRLQRLHAASVTYTYLSNLHLASICWQAIIALAQHLV